MCLNGTPFGNVNTQSAQLPQVTEFKYMGSTLQSDGDMSTEVNKRTHVAGTTGGRCQASYTIREYHHMLKERYTRRSFSRACYAVRDGDSASH